MEEKMLIRQEMKPSDTYGKSPNERTLAEHLAFGLVVIDKPAGPTSHQVSAYVQRILGIEKSGHAGTLDPKVTGVLPVALGKATRLLQFLLKAGKEYVGIMHMHDDVPEYEIRKHAEKFIGTITQLPPKRSAVARRHRQRTIHQFRFLEIRGRDVLFLADVEAGTYIRKLCSDFGDSMKCGAHMLELRRTRAATFYEKQAITLQTLADYFALAKKGDETKLREVIIKGEDIVSHFPKIVLLDSAIHSITQGAMLKVPGIAAVSARTKPGDIVQLVSQKGELVAIATARMLAKNMLGARGIAAKPEKVFLDPEVYPRME